MASGVGRLGRPRDPKVDEAVLRAAIFILARNGYPNLTIDRISQQSGVAKTSIYRRWNSKHEIVLDAIAQQLGELPMPESDDVIADLTVLITGLYKSLNETVAGRALPAISAELLGNTDLAAAYRRRFVEPLRDHALRLLRRGMTDGVLRADLDVEAFIDAVAAPPIFRPLALGKPATSEFGQSILRLVLNGAMIGPCTA